MNTVVLPLCEKCGKPILDGTGVSVDGYIHLIDHGVALGERLVGGAMGPQSFHMLCLKSILTVYILKAAVKRLDDLMYTQRCCDTAGKMADPTPTKNDISIGELFDAWRAQKANPTPITSVTSDFGSWPK